MDKEQYSKIIKKVREVASKETSKKNTAKFSKLMGELDDEKLEELQRLSDQIAVEAKIVVKDYKDNPSETSGSITQVNINSPILNKKSDNDI